MKKRSIQTIVSASVLALAMTLAGCGGGGGSTQTGGVGDAHIMAATDTDIVGFNPYEINDIASAVAFKAIYDTLVYLTSDLELEPGLAKSWEYVDDNTLRFYLHEGVTFHNGEPLTAEDVKFSLERTAESGFVGYLVDMVEGIEVVDDLTVDLKVSDESVPLVANLSHCGASIVSKNHVESLEAEGGSIDDDPVGTGPYIYENWIVGMEWSVRKNDNYFNADRAALNDGFTMRTIPEHNAQVIALKNGEIDLSVLLRPNNIKEIESDPNLEVVNFMVVETTFAAFNCMKEPFDDIRVRRALNHAVNRDDIIQVYLYGRGKPNYTGISVAAVGYTDDVTKYEYDPDKAKALLAEAGYPDGFSFNLLVCTEYYAPAATVWQAALKEIGVDMSIEILEVGAYYDALGIGEHEVGLSGWYAEADPNGTYDAWFNSKYAGQGGNNFACFKSPEVDELLHLGKVTKDTAQRLEYYYEIARVTTEQAVYAPMTSEEGLMAHSKKLSGVTPDPLYIPRFNGIVKSL
jgi:peptide/nickel transport system substrate-binding protein